MVLFKDLPCCFLLWPDRKDVTSLPVRAWNAGRISKTVGPYGICSTMLWIGIGIYFHFFDVPALSHNLLFAILWKWAMRSTRILVSRAWATALSALSWTQWWMMCVSASSWTASNGVVSILRFVDFTSCSSTNPPATIIVFTCSCPTSCSETKRAKSFFVFCWS